MQMSQYGDYKLPDFILQQLHESALLAVTYMEKFSSCWTTVFQNESGQELSSHLAFRDLLLKPMPKKMQPIMRF
jgi:hypothetical protein